MIRMCHYVTRCTLLFISLLATAHQAAAEPVAESDLERIEQQILLTRNQLTQVSAQLRDAKVLAAEKMIEYETSRDAFQREQTAVTANSLDHAQQRLALAEMGVESKAARFERIQRKLEELAEAKQEILAEPPASQTTEPALAVNSRADEETAIQQTLGTAENSQSPELPAPANTNEVTDQLAPLPLVKKMLRQNASRGPVLTREGKISDVYQLNAELQKLEHHLVTQGASSPNPINVKAYGTAIAGEITLSEMGGNQFFARFPAPSGTASVIVGARHGEDYVRTEMQITFLPEEAGKDFVLIFDINTKEQPRALVFQESLAFTQEMFASHGNF